MNSRFSGMTRRSLLQGTGAIVAGSLLASCGVGGRSGLRVSLLANSLPPQLLQEFERFVQQRRAINLSAVANLEALYTLLLEWQKQSANASGGSGFSLGGDRPSAVANLATLGDAWLETAIQQGLIQPFQPDRWNRWPALPAVWQSLVRRNDQGQLANDGQIWGAPYRWGTAVIAYRKEQMRSLNLQPTDWADLWRPELKGYISLPDSPRTVIGLTLKKLNQSANNPAPDTVANFQNELSALHRQVKFYASENYLQPLLVGDTWMAVGWSTDVLPVVKRDRRIAAIVPASGSLLTADLWVRPKTAGVEELGDRLVDFCWQEDTALKLSILGVGASPILTGLSRSSLPQAVQDNSLVLPPADVFDRSDFLQPLSATAQETYRRLWTELRTG